MKVASEGEGNAQPTTPDTMDATVFEADDDEASASGNASKVDTTKPEPACNGVKMDERSWASHLESVGDEEPSQVPAASSQQGDWLGKEIDTASKAASMPPTAPMTAANTSADMSPGGASLLGAVQGGQDTLALLRAILQPCFDGSTEEAYQYTVAVGLTVSEAILREPALKPALLWVVPDLIQTNEECRTVMALFLETLYRKNPYLSIQCLWVALHQEMDDTALLPLRIQNLCATYEKVEANGAEAPPSLEAYRNFPLAQYIEIENVVEGADRVPVACFESMDQSAIPARVISREPAKAYWVTQKAPFVAEKEFFLCKVLVNPDGNKWTITEETKVMKRLQLGIDSHENEAAVAHFISSLPDLRLENVNQDFDVMTDGQSLMIIMPYFPRGNLESVLLELYKAAEYRKMSEAEARYFAIHILNAIQEVQQIGLYHGAMSLTNFYLTSKGVPVLLRFDAAGAVPYGAGIRKLAATPLAPGGESDFRAPELNDPVAPPVDVQAAQIWSFGIVVSRLLFHWLWRGASDQLDPDYKDTYKRLHSEGLSGASPEANELLRGCLHEDPRRRCTTGWAATSLFLQEGPVHAPDMTLFDRKRGRDPAIKS